LSYDLILDSFNSHHFISNKNEYRVLQVKAWNRVPTPKARRWDWRLKGLNFGEINGCDELILPRESGTRMSITWIINYSTAEISAKLPTYRDPNGPTYSNVTELTRTIMKSWQALSLKFFLICHMTQTHSWVNIKLSSTDVSDHIIFLFFLSDSITFELKKFNLYLARSGYGSIWSDSIRIK
jgi:hypothetical protein